jgi:hypothetical protein
MRDTARRRDCVALAVWAHSDLPLTTIRVLLGERGPMTQKDVGAGGKLTPLRRLNMHPL